MILAAPAMGACGRPDCKSIASAGLDITVQTADGAPICDAVVAVDSEDAVGQLAALPRADGSCPYIGIYSKGTYTVRVVAGGVEQRIEDVHVTLGDCSLDIQRLTVTFPPTT